MLNNTARSAMTLVSQLTVLTILLLSFHALSSAENEISIEDFAFMSGYWRGEGMGWSVGRNVDATGRCAHVRHFQTVG